MDKGSFLARIWGFLKKPVVSLILRVAVSGLLLAYLIQLSAFTGIALAFQRINPLYLLYFFIAYFLSVSLQALRWKILLKAWDVSQPFSILFRRILIGLFFNNFLPGSLGGDAFRLYAGGRDTGKVEAVTATIFYERILSYASLVTLGLIVLSIRFDFASDWLFWFLLGGVFLILVGIMAVSSLPAIGNWIETIVGRFRFAEKLRLRDWIHSFRFKVRHPAMLAGVVFISFLIQIIDIFSYRLIAVALQLPVRLMDLFLFVPLLYLAILLPISVNGIGIRESVFVTFSSAWGITSSDAVAFSLTVFALNLAGSLVGGIFYWFDRSTRTGDTDRYEISR